MRAFTFAAVAAVLLAVGAAIGLGFIQKSSAQAETTGSARLGPQESVNSYGRVG
jgi:hypothetical protein